MRASWRFGVATGILALVGVGLYACSSDGTGSTPGTDSGGGSETSPTAETGPGTDAPSGQDAGTDTNQPPKKCAIFTGGDASRAPPLAPAACKDCAAEKCCAQITSCYGGAPADAGFDGANGSKTNCELYGECEVGCNGVVTCEDGCVTLYGEPAANSFAASETCIFTTAAPAGCQANCQQ